MGYAVFAIIVAVLLVRLFFMRGRRRA